MIYLKSIVQLLADLFAFKQDNGDEFYYTGSGGRDLSGNKRVAEQSCDQKLTKMNRALARNCAAPLSEKERVKAKDWKAGKPVRVVGLIDEEISISTAFSAFS